MLTEATPLCDSRSLFSPARFSVYGGPKPLRAQRQRRAREARARARRGRKTARSAVLRRVAPPPHRGYPVASIQSNS